MCPDAFRDSSQMRQVMPRSKRSSESSGRLGGGDRAGREASTASSKVGRLRLETEEVVRPLEWFQLLDWTVGRRGGGALFAFDQAVCCRRGGDLRKTRWSARGHQTRASIWSDRL